MAPNDKSTTTTESSTDDIPKWLKEDYFAEILIKQFGSGLKIKNFIAKPAVAKGENYASIMFRVTIDLFSADGKEHRISYLVKALPESELHEEMIKTMSLFPKETEMYGSMIPKMEAIYREIGEDIRFSPESLKSTKEPEAFVMEDLSLRGFANENRLEGLDTEHIKFCLTKLAKFHAASVIIWEREGPFTEHFLNGVYTEKVRPMFETIIVENKKIMMECMNGWGIDQSYIDKFDAMYSDSAFFDKIMDCVAIDWDAFNVLNHGDLWTNNIMFKHTDDGKIDEMLFVDLQICKWGSPAYDLTYFLISSCNYDIKVRDFDYLIKFYYDELIENLKKLNYSKPLPRLVDIHCQLLKRGFFAIMTAMGVMAAVLLDPTEDANMEAFMKTDEKSVAFKRKIYSNPRLAKAMKQLLPFFDNKGFMDI